MNHTENIRAVLEAATDQQWIDGMDWYRDASDVATEIAETFGISYAKAGGVIAALSPRNSWGSNISLARHVLTQHQQGQPLTGYLGMGLRKVERILAGEPIEATLHGVKVRAFFACIVGAGETDEVCVDRHAYAIAWNYRADSDVRVTLSASRRIADAYREVAADVGLFAAQVQAITWTTWRARHWAPGAWDRPAVFTVQA